MRGFYRILVMVISVMGVMKMGNVVPRAGIEPTSIALRASVLTIIPCRLPLNHHYTHVYLFMQSMQFLASEVSESCYRYYIVGV